LQFTIQTLGELDIVSNQHLSIEMFLLRLIHIKGFKPKNENQSTTQEHNYQKDSSEVNIPTKIINKDTINQIKNVSQEKKIKLDPKIDTKVLSEIKIQSFSELVDLCASKKEMKLKYELEKNVNLVKFEN